MKLDFIPLESLSVCCSNMRHGKRPRTDLYYGKEMFKTEPQLVRTLGRVRGKDMVGDYAPIADRA